LTATIAALGLTPFLFATGPGAEIQRPLAIVVIGGLVTATLLTLILLPILYDRFALPRAEREKVEAFIANKQAIEAAANERLAAAAAQNATRPPIT
jgi:cobalt-zinc-cadmium resistance protein CzcA